MTKFLDKKKRGLTCGLSQLLSADISEDSLSTERVNLTPPSNAEFYGVIRTKGGSGEVHTVKKLIDELISTNKKIIVCYETQFTNDENAFTLNYFQYPVNKLINLCDIGDEKGGVINLNWRINSELSNLFSTVANLEGEYAIIMTTGTSSGGNLIERVGQISPFCNRVFITVDSLVDNSVAPGIRLCFSQKIELQKIYFCWWHKIQLDDKTEHLFGLFRSKELTTIAPSELNTKLRMGMVDADVEMLG